MVVPLIIYDHQGYQRRLSVFIFMSIARSYVALKCALDGPYCDLLLTAELSVPFLQ